MKSLIALSLLLSFSAFAKTDHSVCPVNQDDPFATELRMPGGPYKGRCINSNNYRSVRSVSELDKKEFNLSPSSDVFVVANFRHLDRFWIAEIPLKSIERVEFQKMALQKSVPIYHGQLRFIMNGDAIRLTSQEKDLSKRVVLELKEKSGKPQDFVIALFGVRDLEHDLASFNPSMGIGIFGKSKYAISYAFQSMFDGSQWALDHKQHVQQFPLEIDRAKQLEILSVTRSMGDEKGVGEMYDVMTNNCLNFVFTVLNKVVVGEKRVTKRLRETRIPISSLKKLGLIQNKKDFHLLDEEFPQGIERIE